MLFSSRKTTHVLLLLAFCITSLWAADELLRPDNVTMTSAKDCKSEFETHDGLDCLVLQGTSPEVFPNNSKIHCMLFTLHFKEAVSLVENSMLIKGKINARIQDCNLNLRAYNQGQRKASWMFRMRLAHRINAFKDNTIVLTTGISDAATWIGKYTDGSPPDKITSIELRILTKTPNNPVKLMISSIKTAKNSEIPKSDNIGFSAKKENWETIKAPVKLPTETLLIKNRHPQFDIIHPDSQAGREAAQRIADAFKKLCPASSAPQLIPGTLEQRVPKRTAILIGNIFDNPAMLTIYARRAILADKKWPGPGGHVVRTVFEPFQRNADIIALEASDDAGMLQATDAFLRLLGENARQEKENVTLPRLFELKLPDDVAVPKIRKDHVQKGLVKAKQILDQGKHTSLGGYLATIARNYLLSQNSLDAKLYVEVCRFYQKSAIADPRRFGGPWGFDSDFPSIYAIAGWDLIEHDPILTDEDRLDATQCILAWLNQAIAAEAAGGIMSTGVVSNHLTFCSLGAMIGGLYFSKNYPQLKTPEDWLSIIKRNFHRQIYSGKVRDDSDGYQWLTWRHCSLYSIIMSDDTFFTHVCPSGHATAKQGIIICGQTMDNLWTQAPYGDTENWSSTGFDMHFLRIMYAMTRDSLAGTILALKTERWHNNVQPPGLALKKLPRYIQGVCDFNGEYKVHPEPALLGMQCIDLDPIFRETFANNMPVPPIERCFDKLSFRKELSPDAFYMLVDGINIGAHGHEDGASILRLTLHDREWLMENGYTKPQQKFHNTLLLLTDGQAFPVTDYIEMLNRGETDNFAWAIIRANGYGPSDWTRHLFWLKDEDALIVIDEIKALKSANFQIKQRWNCIGTCSQRNDGMHLVQKGPSFRIQCWDNTKLLRKIDTNTWKGWKNYPFATVTAHTLDQCLAETLEAGSSVQIGALLHGSPTDKTPAWQFQREDFGFKVDTGQKLYSINYGSEGSSPSCSVAPSRTSIAEPSKPSKVTETRFSGGIISALHTFHAKGAERSVREIRRAMPFTDKGEERYALVTRLGKVCILDAEAKLLSSFDSGVTVHDLATADLDGDGIQEILLACDDASMRAYRLDGTLFWKHDFPFYRLPGVCTLVRIADLEGDGKITILAGCDNWRVYALSPDGKELWNTEIVHPTKALETADINGDGKLEILCGSSYYFAIVLDCKGNIMLGGNFGHGVKAVAAARTGAKQSTFVIGEDKGIITFRRTLTDAIATFATGDEILHAMPIPISAKKDDILVCSNNGFSYRFSHDGKLIWARDLGGAVLRCCAFTNGNAAFATENGDVVLLDKHGNAIASCHLDSKINDLRVLSGERLIACTQNGTFAILKP